MLHAVGIRTTLALTLLASSLLSGCVSSSLLHNEKVGPQTPTLAGVLVAGRTPDSKLRAQWENHCAKALGDLALASSQTAAVEASFPNDQEAIMKVARNNNLSAVLFAEISPLKLYASQLPATTESQAERLGQSGGTLNIPLRGEKNTVPELPEQYIEFSLVNLQQQVLWSAIVQTHEANAIKPIAQSQCKSIRKAWQNHGWLAP